MLVTLAVAIASRKSSKGAKRPGIGERYRRPQVDASGKDTGLSLAVFNGVGDLGLMKIVQASIHDGFIHDLIARRASLRRSTSSAPITAVMPAHLKRVLSMNVKGLLILFGLGLMLWFGKMSWSRHPRPRRRSHGKSILMKNRPVWCCGRLNASCCRWKSPDGNWFRVLWCAFVGGQVGDDAQYLSGKQSFVKYPVGHCVIEPILRAVCRCCKCPGHSTTPLVPVMFRRAAIPCFMT